MKKIITYCFGILLTGCIVTSCQDNNNIPSLHQTFSKDEDLPFGTKVAHKLLQQMYPADYINNHDNNFSLFWGDANYSNYDTASLYICICRNLQPSSEDIGSMINYVKNGNTLFISAAKMSDELLDTLGCTLKSIEDNYDDWSNLRNSYVYMNPALNTDSTEYGYYFLPFQNCFTAYDSSNTRVLGMNDYGSPDFIVIFLGKGRLYLHCAPAALSNYFLLQQDNYKYLQNVFSFEPQDPQYIYWDDYYNRHSNDHTRVGLGALLQYPAIKWAFFLSLALLLLYIIFGGKRRQRIVPVLSPMKNTTVAYTETISRLYLQKKDNKNIADKMITYFFEYIRNQFYLNTSHVDEDLINMLSRKSAVPKEATAALFKTISEIQQQTTVKDQQLLLLNKQIEDFYKNRK